MSAALSHNTPQPKPTCSLRLPSNIQTSKSDRVTPTRRRTTFSRSDFRPLYPSSTETKDPSLRPRLDAKKAAAAFLEKQAQVIAGSERALALYVAALKELAEADQSLRQLQDTHLQMMKQSVRLGEEDRLALTAVQIESSVVARARLDALTRAQSALGELEDAVQRPLDPGDLFPLNPGSSVLNKSPQES